MLSLWITHGRRGGFVFGRGCKFGDHYWRLNGFRSVPGPWNANHESATFRGHKRNVLPAEYLVDNSVPHCGLRWGTLGRTCFGAQLKRGHSPHEL